MIFQIPSLTVEFNKSVNFSHKNDITDVRGCLSLLDVKPCSDCTSSTSAVLTLCIPDNSLMPFQKWLTLCSTLWILGRQVQYSNLNTHSEVLIIKEVCTSIYSGGAFDTSAWMYIHVKKKWRIVWGGTLMAMEHMLALMLQLQNQKISTLWKKYRNAVNNTCIFRWVPLPSARPKKAPILKICYIM